MKANVYVLLVILGQRRSQPERKPDDDKWNKWMRRLFLLLTIAGHLFGLYLKLKGK